jgi:hydrogenase large subunit
VTNAWSSGQMWRGFELILKGRDPRDAWVITQRFCGV